MAAGFSSLYAADNSNQLVASLADGTTPVSTYMEKGFTFVEMLIEKGYMDAEFALNTAPQSDDLSEFLAGNGAFICTNLENFPSEADFEVVMTGIPTKENGMVAVVGANYRFSVNPNSTKAEYAIELLNAVATAESLAQIAADVGGLSCGTGEYDTDYLDEGAHDFARLVQKGGQIPNQDFALPFNTWESIRDLCREICAGMSAEAAALKYDTIQSEAIG